MSNKQSAIRYGLFALILLLFFAGSYTLCLRFISRFNLLKAVNCIQEGDHDRAVSHLEKAINYQPDDPLTWKTLGKAYHKLSVSKPVKEAYLLLKKAKHAYLNATRINPLDAEAVYGLAEQESLLENIYPFLHPLQEDNPHLAYPHFQEAIRLRPNGILYHYAFARYLYRRASIKEFREVVRDLVRIFPPSYSNLKKEPFWSPPVKKIVKEGLKQALKEGFSPREAHMAISSLLEEEKDLKGAIYHYQKALSLQVFDNRTNNYIHLGRLYLKEGRHEDAENSFFKALSMSDTREKDLEGLYSLYKRTGYAEELFRFYQDVNEKFPLSFRMDILLARSLIDLKRFHQAQRVLKELNRKRPTAEAWYWLSRIAEQEKDWDSMELAIQKATVLDPGNSSYHLIFSKVLKRMKKFKRAEKELSLAMENSARPSPGLYNRRAWLRWRDKDYKGAINDWESAIALNPKNASYHASIAEAYLKLGNLSLSVEYYKNATELNSNIKSYQKRYKELKTALDDTGS